MKAYGEAELQSHLFLTMESEGDEWESRPVITVGLCRMTTILSHFSLLIHILTM